MTKRKKAHSVDEPESKTQEKAEHASSVEAATSAEEVGEPVQQKKKRAAKRKEEPGFPIAGIGASAGGLEALEKFFTNMPAESDCGMAFVLVQHLDPTHKSILGDLVRRYTSMKVYEVEDGMEVKPNCAYIIPPNRDMALLHGKLHLMQPESPRGLRLPIDFFFRSLAQDRGERAICIVLAGTGTDGTLGLKAVKGEGGMAIVQDPKSAKYDGMPRSAIATGLVDYVLSPEKMPAQLLAYVEHAFGKEVMKVAEPPPKVIDSLQKIFILLRAQTGHDFSYYKQNTIRRRIKRRMAVNQIEQIDHYVHYLQQTPLEVETLFRELLIGVTNFFRDPKAFEALKEQMMSPLFAQKPPGSTVRVWVTGCSTGEEAFSIAILFREHLDELRQDFKIQIFATDIDAEAIETARAGIYPESIAADVSPERLVRFFSQEDSAYRIKKTIRDMVVFAEQNVIEDPPFSKIDLISCRNLLIYMGPELQKKVVPLFHYALSQDGFLFLGSSETIGEFVDLFAVVDRKWKLYQRKGVVSPHAVLLDFPPPPQLEGMTVPLAAKQREEKTKIDVRELIERTLLVDYTPACIIVNEKGEVLYIHGRTGKYLEPASGEASLNILRMAREGMRLELTTAIRKAVVQKETIRYEGLRVKGNGEIYTVNLIARPVTKPVSMQGLVMLLFEDVTPEKSPQPLAVSEPITDKDQYIVDLERELRAKEEHLQTTIEELETSNEELKSTNEELQSTNEELQSTNEELETSKEELQSINEELVTVNTELQKKVDELSQANNDMSNLMAGTGIGTIFVDHQLRIQRFTPAVTKIINLIQTDVGRPVGDLVSNLVNCGDLAQEVSIVLDTLIPKEANVQARDGLWYLMRILPYRTVENVIEGAVITFVEITKLRQAQEALQESEAKWRSVAENSPDYIILLDREATIEFINRSFRPDLTVEQMLGTSIYDYVSEEFKPTLQKKLRHVLQTGQSTSYETAHHNSTDETLYMESYIGPVEQDDQIVGLVVSSRDVTERKQTEQSNQRLAIVVRDSNDGITVQDFEGRILAWNPGAERMYGWSEAEALAMNIRDIAPEDKREEALAFVKRLAQGAPVEPFKTQRITKEGQILDVWLVASLLVDEEAGQPYAAATTERDVTDRAKQ